MPGYVSAFGLTSLEEIQTLEKELILRFFPYCLFLESIHMLFSGR